MAFQPWHGNFNPTDQQKNEYIRLLKNALVDQTAYRIETGTYTGDGNANQTVSLTDTLLTPAFVVVGTSAGNDRATMAWTNFTTGIKWRVSVAPSAASQLDTLQQGSFRVLGGTGNGFNVNTETYSYFVVGN